MASTFGLIIFLHGKLRTVWLVYHHQLHYVVMHNFTYVHTECTASCKGNIVASY